MNVTYSFIPNQKSMEKLFILKSSIMRSNSDTDLFRLVRQYKSYYENGTECSHLEKIIGNPKHYTKKKRQAMMFYKSKNRLSEFIQHYSNNLRLIGNKRYNEYNPFLFVKDQKQKVSLTKIGLFPVPLKSQHKVSSNEEMDSYKNIQRSMVSMRRIQYEKNKQAELLRQRDKSKEREKRREIAKANSKIFYYDLDAIIKIQQWWKLNHKIIQIQKFYKQQIRKKEKHAVNNSTMIVNSFEETLIGIKAKQCFKLLKVYCALKRVCLKPNNITKGSKRHQKNTKKDSKNDNRKEGEFKTIHNKVISEYRQYSFITKSTQIKLDKIRAMILVNRIIRQYKLHQKKKMIIERELLLPMMSFKINLNLPSITSNLIKDNIKKYFNRQKALHKPISILDMQNLHYVKGKATYTTKESMKHYDCNKSNNEEVISIPLYEYENYAFYITKKRYIDNSGSVVLLQRKIGLCFKSLKNKKQSTICFVDKVLLNIEAQNLIAFCNKVKDIMKRSYFKQKLHPLLNQQYDNRIIDYLNVNNDEMNYLLFLQRQVKKRYLKSMPKPNDTFHIGVSYVSITRISNKLTLIIKLQRMNKKYKSKVNQSKIAIKLPIKDQSFISKMPFVLDDILYDKNKNNKILRSKAVIREKEILENPVTNNCFITKNQFNSRIRIEKCKRVILNYFIKTIYPIKETSLINSLLNDYNYPQSIYNNHIIKKDLCLNYYSSKIRIKKQQEDFSLLNNDNEIIHKDQFLFPYLLSSNNSNYSCANYISKKKKTNLIPFITIIQRAYAIRFNIVTKDKASICFFTKEHIGNNIRNLILIKRLQKEITKRILGQSDDDTDHHNSNIVTFRAKHKKSASVSEMKKEKIQKGEITKIIKRKDRSSSVPKIKSITNTRPIIKYYFARKKRINQTKHLEHIIRIQSTFRSYIYQKEFYRNLDKIKSDRFSWQYIPKKKKNTKLFPRLEQSFMMKIYKRVIQKPNIKFIALINLFATKNTQEYVYPLLFNTKYNNKTINNNNTGTPTSTTATSNLSLYPFYLNAIDRNLKFINSSQSSDSKVKETLDEIFPFHTQSTNLIDQVFALNTPLNQIKEFKLWNYNIYDQIDEDLIDYLNSFCIYDKKFNNPKFIRERIKQVKLNNTSIFGLTKHIDNEYSNLIKGVFCFQCYYPESDCECKTINNNNDDDDQYEIDDESFDDFSIRNSINHFDYENICQGVLLKRKPKINEGYENTKTQVVLITDGIEEKKSPYQEIAFQSEENKESQKVKAKHINNMPNSQSRYDSIYKESKRMSQVRKSLNPAKDNNSRKMIKMRDNIYFDAR